ncbi:YdcF family protein [Devosia sp.]|uniref:YdcF family protein n=1 Tax=Devosia sp. TaxID=1871048 RepID=UPI003A903E0C
MFVYVTRLFWLVAQPLSLATLLLIVGVVFGFTRWRWLSRGSLVLGLAIILICSFTTFGYLLIQPLEARFARPAEPAQIAGIVVLGGGMRSATNPAGGDFELNRSGDRMVEAVRLALRHPEAKVLITGGAGPMAPGRQPEAVTGEKMLRAFGIADDRILLEPKARNTEENAQFSKALVAASGIESGTWLLITSGFHMPRAVGLFRRAGFDVVPWPADFLSDGTETVGIRLDDSGENLAVATMALREWIGLVAYFLTGRIDEVLPGPAPAN